MSPRVCSCEQRACVSHLGQVRRLVIDIPSNPHLQALARPGVLPIVWETKDRKKGSLARSILDPIAVAGQEPLLDFPCKSIYNDIQIYSFDFIYKLAYTSTYRVIFVYALMYSIY
jgi:hypothetical protein